MSPFVRTLAGLAVFVLSIASATAPASATRQRSAPQLAALWSKLDGARAYREGFRGGKSYTQMIAGYQSPNIDLEGKEPQRVFLELIGIDLIKNQNTGLTQCTSESNAPSFVQFLSNPTLSEEAEWGLQEALNEVMTGQLLIGNESLLRGLRTRFPSTGDPADPDQLTLLKLSSNQFRCGTDAVVKILRTHPTLLRSDGTILPNFPFYVENTPKPPAAQGDIVENELYRFTDLVKRLALAKSSVGKRLYFFSNDRKPAELDVARTSAATELKQSAQATYLHTAVLASVQHERAFGDNNGAELKREIVDAQRVFGDILAGFNPLKLRGDFVPHQPFENLLGTFKNLLQTAKSDELTAIQNARQYDNDQTQLARELGDQQERYVASIAELMGVPVNTVNGYDLLTQDGRDRLFADADGGVRFSSGRLGQAFRAIELAANEARLAYEQVRQIPEQIRIEEERNRQVARITLSTGQQLAALDVAIGIAGAIPSICTCGTSSGSQINIGSAISGLYRSTQTLLQATQSATIGNINSAATIKNLLLQQVAALIAVERADLQIQARRAEYDAERAVLDRAVRNYVASQEGLATAYFTNPAYRLQQDLTRENAEKSFEAAMVAGYFAVKTLEYEWAERLENPVRRLDGLPAEPIGDASQFNPIVRAESVFAARSAGSGATPRLEEFALAMQSWDTKLRQLRPTQSTAGQIEVVSLRRDILGLTGGDENYNRLVFRDWIAKRRIPGRNAVVKDLLAEFSLEIADDAIFPATLPNLKIERLELNLRALPSRSLTGPGYQGGSPNVQLVMLDQSFTRTFFADFPEDDDLLAIDLEGSRTLAKSPFFASVQAKIGGQGGTSNDQLQNRSPGVSRWTIFIDSQSGENRNLLLENLDDIEITFTYKAGKPRTFSF